jgi:hypothetical protein
MSGKALGRLGGMYVMYVMYIVYQKLARFGLPFDRPRRCTTRAGTVSISGGVNAK